MDLSLEISKNANRVILSHHLTETIDTVFPENVVQVKARIQSKIAEILFSRKVKYTYKGQSRRYFLSDRDGFFYRKVT